MRAHYVYLDLDLASKTVKLDCHNNNIYMVGIDCFSYSINHEKQYNLKKGPFKVSFYDFTSSAIVTVFFPDVALIKTSGI